MKYYIVEACHLGEYGDENGIESKEEVEKLLSGLSQDEIDNFVVIKGVEVPFSTRIAVELEENE